MARTQKFNEDILLTAVVKYSEICKGKIKATELAEWSRNNIEGLAEVRDYHFTRPVKEHDVKTGKIKKRLKLCTIKINEINKNRSVATSINTNILLSASNCRAMFELPQIEQEKLIVDTRQVVSKLFEKSRNLQRENAVIQQVNREQVAIIRELENRIKDIEKKQNQLEKKINYILRITDEEMRLKMLENMGIADGIVDLNVYKKKIEEDLEEVFNIKKVLTRYLREEEKYNENANDNNNITNEILKGLDF